MSEIRVNNITNRDGTAGPSIAGIPVVDSNSHFVVPTGRTGQRYADGGENIVRDGLVLYLDAKYSYPGATGTNPDVYTWYDMSGNENNGELKSGIPYTTNGQGSFTFNASSYYIETERIKISDSKNFTVEIFVNPETTQNSYANILDYDHSNGGFTIQQSAASTNYFGIGYQYSSVGPLYYTSTPILIIAGQWNHLVFTKNDDQIIGYLNGQKQFENIGNINVVNLFDRIAHIGKWVSGSRFFYGKISIARMYNRALSASEVSQNFEALRSRFGI